MDVEKVCNLIFLKYQLYSYTILVEFCVRLKTSDLCSEKKNLLSLSISRCCRWARLTRIEIKYKHKNNSSYLSVQFSDGRSNIYFSVQQNSKITEVVCLYSCAW